jgi:hypothetical protein
MSTGQFKIAVLLLLKTTSLIGRAKACILDRLWRILPLGANPRFVREVANAMEALDLASSIPSAHMTVRELEEVVFLCSF